MTAPQEPARAERKINQFLPNLTYGDAISHYAIWIRDTLRSEGCSSEIFARVIDERIAKEGVIFSAAALSQSDAAIYHHSVGSDLTQHLINHSGSKCLIYHNITPADFFRPFSPAYAEILEQGRRDLAAMAPHFVHSLGVSAYNADELRRAHFRNPGVLPIAFDPEVWDVQPDLSMQQKLQDGRTNIVFVGRIAPNKKQDDLVRAFEQYLRFDSTARLVLIGKAEERDPYADHVRSVIETLGLQDHVLINEGIGRPQLAACYRSAHLFWSMSEHEGFCVPLVEAMWFEIPILAYNSSAVPDTLGRSGLLFTDKSNLRELAAAAYLLRTDDALRTAVMKQQRVQRERYLPQQITPRLQELAAKLTTE